MADLALAAESLAPRLVVELEELHQYLSERLKVDVGTEVTVFAAGVFEAFVAHVLEAAVTASHDVRFKAATKTAERLLSPRTLQYALRTDADLSALLADVPAVQHVCDCQLDASTARLLVQLGVIDAAPKPSNSLRTAQRRGPPARRDQRRGSSLEPASASNRRRRNVLTERDLAGILKTIHPVFALSHDSISLLQALLREVGESVCTRVMLRFAQQRSALLRTHTRFGNTSSPPPPGAESPSPSQSQSPSPSPSPTKEGSSPKRAAMTLTPALFAASVQHVVRSKELSAALTHFGSQVVEAFTAPKPVAPPLRIFVRAIRGTTVFATRGFRLDDMNEPASRLFARAGDRLRLGLDDKVFLYRGHQVLDNQTWASVGVLPDSTVFLVEQARWQFQQRAEASRGLLTSVKYNGDAVRRYRQQATSRLPHMTIQARNRQQRPAAGGGTGIPRLPHVGAAGGGRGKKSERVAGHRRLVPSPVVGGRPSNLQQPRVVVPPHVRAGAAAPGPETPAAKALGALQPAVLLQKSASTLEAVNQAATKYEALRKGLEGMRRKVCYVQQAAQAASKGGAVEDPPEALHGLDRTSALALAREMRAARDVTKEAVEGMGDTLRMLARWENSSDVVAGVEALASAIGEKPPERPRPRPRPGGRSPSPTKMGASAPTVRRPVPPMHRSLPREPASPASTVVASPAPTQRAPSPKQPPSAQAPPAQVAAAPETSTPSPSPGPISPVEAAAAASATEGIKKRRKKSKSQRRKSRRASSAAEEEGSEGAVER